MLVLAVRDAQNAKRKGQLNRAANRFNDGRRFEDLVARVAEQYKQRRILRLEKVDPPTRIIGNRIIFLANPFADFIGAWTERGGRTIVLESKSTKEERLQFGNKLTDAQIMWLERWHHAGAVVGVLWESNYRVGFLPIGRIMDAVKAKRRSVTFDEADPVPQGKGFIVFDFVDNLRRWYPDSTH